MRVEERAYSNMNKNVSNYCFPSLTQFFILFLTFTNNNTNNIYFAINRNNLLFSNFPLKPDSSEGVNPTNVTNKTSNLISLEFFNQLHTLHNSLTVDHENPGDNNQIKGIYTLFSFKLG